MLRRSRILIHCLVLISILSMTLVSCSKKPNTAAAANAPTPTPIPTSALPANPTFTVQKGDVSAQIQFSGRVSPATEEELYFRTDGRVRHVYVKRNEVVKAGQVLADLQIDDLERQLAILLLNVESQKIQLEVAKLRLAQAEGWPQTIDTRYEVAFRKYDVELNELAVQRASLDEKDLRANISNAQIVASFDGTVLSVGLSEGSSVEGYKPEIVVADLSVSEITATLTNTELQKLKEGMPITAIVIGRPGSPITGTIRKLPYPYGSGGASTNVQETDTSTHIALDPEGMKTLQMGDLLRVTCVLEKRVGVLWLPPQAIRTYEGRKFVSVREDNGVERRVDVTIGLEGEDRVEITDGVTEGQIVVGP